jgi:hypothetical protein
MPVENQHPGLLCTPKEQARFREVKDIGDPLLKPPPREVFLQIYITGCSAKNETQSPQRPVDGSPDQNHLLI